MSNRKSIVFLCGVARSGTTALTEILNLHEKIVIGVERYKYLWPKHDTLENPFDLFQAERFFKHEAEDTNIPLDRGKYKDLYHRAEAKYDKAQIVGDKVPNLYLHLPFLRRHYPHSKVVFILRNPERVASSWQQRADRPKDKWPEKNDFKAAIREWNRALKIVSNEKDAWGEDLILLSYEKSFGPDGAAVFSTLFSRLGLNSDMPSAIGEFIVNSAERISAAEPVSNTIQDHTTIQAEFDLYEHLLTQTI